MVAHTRTHDRCPVCGKAVLTSWAEAERQARLVRHRRGRKVIPYWSRRCRCYHCGATSRHIARLTKPPSRENIEQERRLP